MARRREHDAGKVTARYPSRVAFAGRCRLWRRDATWRPPAQGPGGTQTQLTGDATSDAASEFSRPRAHHTFAAMRRDRRIGIAVDAASK